MLPLSRSRSRLSISHDDHAESPSRPSGFSRLMQRVSSGSRTRDHEGFAAAEVESSRRRMSSSHQEFSRDTASRHRASPSSASIPRAVYGPSSTPSPARQAYKSYTSSPSPLARRSESRQSFRTTDNPPSRAQTPTPRDFHPTAASESFPSDDDDDDDDDENDHGEGQSTTPRKGEIRRWVPRNVSARGARYASEPPEVGATRESTAYHVRPVDKVEQWMAGDGYLGEERRRAALPKEFRITNSRSHSTLSRYTDMPDSPHHAVSARESPFRRSESLHLAGLVDSRPEHSPTTSIRRSATLHATGSPLRSRLGSVSGTSESPTSPDLQRAESRRRRAALLEEMSTPLRASVRAHPATDARPTSRMSGSSTTHLRPSTSMSSFRNSLGADNRRFRREATRPSSVVSGGESWRVDTSRHDLTPVKPLARGPSPTLSIAVSAVPTGTPSRAIVNRLLATLRHPSGDADTHAMIHACIALQESLASRASEADMAFKLACQVIATDTHQINANLAQALAVIAQSSAECEQAASPEEAQIGAIAALQTLGDLLSSSRRVSEEKIKSLHEVFARLSRQSGHMVMAQLPSVQEDEARADGEALNIVAGQKQAADDQASAGSAPRQQTMPEASTSERPNAEPSQSTSTTDDTSAVEHPPDSAQIEPPTQVSITEPSTSDPPIEASSSVPPSTSEPVKARARKASSSSISVSLSPSNSFKITRSPAPPSLTHKASFMPSSLSMRTPTIALSRINVGSADEPEFDFDVKPKAKPVDQVDEESQEESAETSAAKPTDTEPSRDAIEAFKLNPLSLEIQTTPSAGRGVFATSDIPAQTIVEESPVLVLTKREWDEGKLDDGVLGGYGFNWTVGGMGVGLGIASMFNHSPQPNVMFTRVAPPASEPDKYPKLVFRTIKPINKGDELCICYSADESKLWFSPNYKKEGDDANGQVDEPEWIAPMCDDEDQVTAVIKGSTAEQDVTDSGNPPTKLVSAPNNLREQVTNKTGNQKYQDRKARKQSKREKKVKKTKADAGDKQTMDVDVSDKQNTAPANEEEAPGLDKSSALSASDYASALAKLNLVPAIAVAESDVELERRLDVPASNGDDRESTGAWSLVKRIRGPIEAQENDGDRTVEVWAVSIADKKLVPLVLKYLRLHEKRFLALDHVKRVNHQKEQGKIFIAVAPITLITRDALLDELAEFNTSLTDCDLVQAVVPATYARDLADVTEKAKLWPVLLDAAPQNPADMPWTLSRKAWVRKGVNRLLELAQTATDAGELPVAAIATSAPEGALPSDPDMIPPTPNMRANASDKRISLNHPLKHAAMECVAEIAHLRTQSPFTETMAARNGADYLLTSLSLFITHEPCVMCTMALLHSRVKEIFFLVRNSEGGFGGSFAIHGHPGLNHKIDVYDCSKLVKEEALAHLTLPEGTEP